MTPQTQQNGGRGAWGRPGAGCLALVVLAALVMGLPTLRGGFVGGDDHRLALDHVFVNRPSLSHAVRLFGIFHRDLYQPLPLLSFQTEFALTKVFGLYDRGPDAFAWLFHLTNVLFHACNTALVWFLLVRVHRAVRSRRDDAFLPPMARAGPSRDAPESHAVATIAALLFAIHPLQTEVVAWLNGRMFLMSTFFGLGALLAFAAILERGQTPQSERPGLTGPVVLTLLLALLSAMSKVRAGLPLLMLVVALAYRPKVTWRLVGVWLSVAAITGGFILLNVRATAEAELFALAGEHLRGPRLVRVIQALGFYLQHFFWPVGLASYYPTEPEVSWGDQQTLWSLGILAVSFLLMGLACWRSQVARLGIAWFFIAIADTLPFVPARNVLAADRYMYLPIIGLLWPVAVFGFGAVRTASALWIRWAGLAVGVAIGAATVGMCWYVAYYYETPLKKTLRVAELFPDVPRVAEKLGWSYYNTGDYERAIELAERELGHDAPSVRSGAYQLMGMSELKRGRHEEALRLLHRAVEVDPDDALAKYRLGQAYDELRNDEQARRYYEAAVAAAPQQNPTLHRLAAVYRRLGEPQKARDLYNQQLENNPYEVPAIMGLVELDLQKATPESLVAAEERLLGLLEWMPDNLDARVNLGAVYAALGRIDQAAKVYQYVLGQYPFHATALMNLAEIHFARGDLARAGPLFERALDTGPTALKEAPIVEQFDHVYRVYRAVLEGEHEKAAGLVEAACSAGPGSAELRARLVRALERLDQQAPGNPWTYCLVARLLIADGRTDAARAAVDLCRQLCREPLCQAYAEDLAAQIALASGPTTDPGRRPDVDPG